MKEAKKKKLRFPRPQGITYLCQEYNGTLDPIPNPIPNSKKHKKEPINTIQPIDDTKKNIYTKIQNKYIRAILNNNILIKDHNTNTLRLLNLKDLSIILNAKEEWVLREMAREMARIGNIIDNGKSDITRANILWALNWASETRALTIAQTHTLLRAQGNKYVPFLTSEVNKSIANLIASNKPLLDVLRILIPQNQTNILIPNSEDKDGQSTDNGQYVSAESAIKLLNDRQNNLLTNGTDFEEISSQLGTLPEVHPNLQGGDILTGTTIQEDIKGSTKGRKKQSNEIDEILEEEDFLGLK